MEAAAPPSFFCPISKEIMRDPVIVVADGHTYERAEIERWFRQSNKSPVTNNALYDTARSPNHALRNSIEEWLEKNFKLLPLSAISYVDTALSTGSLKTVHRGTLSGHPQPVAVLRMRNGGTVEEEAAKLVKLGRHNALVRYLGICTEGPEQLLITELALHGSLDSFLEQHEAEVTMQHKLLMLEQVCSGMVALDALGIVHRDLAARNVLVFDFDAQNYDHPRQDYRLRPGLRPALSDARVWSAERRCAVSLDAARGAEEAPLLREKRRLVLRRDRVGAAHRRRRALCFRYFQ
jgi:hypothetical protein